MPAVIITTRLGDYKAMELTDFLNVHPNALWTVLLW